LRDVAHLSPLQQILLLLLLRLRGVAEIIIHIIIIIIHGLLRRRRRRVPAARSSATASLPARLFRLLDDGVKVTIESQRVSLIHVADA